MFEKKQKYPLKLGLRYRRLEKNLWQEGSICINHVDFCSQWEIISVFKEAGYKHEPARWYDKIVLTEEQLQEKARLDEKN